LEIELEKPRQQHENQQLSASFQVSPIKFKTALEELGNKHALLNCGIEKIDSILKLTLGDRLAIIGNQKYTQTLITRLYVNALLSSKKNEQERSRFFLHI
jgi:F0F1-type ATP synthase alpha subunit